MRIRKAADIEQLLRESELATVASGRDPLHLPVLVLNRFFQPVRITSARRAFVLLYTGTARALDDHGECYDFGHWQALPVRDGVDDVVPIVSGELRVPRIVHLERYARAGRPRVRLTRQNLMLRDGYQCQYCGRRGTTRLLDLDHVQPRSRGGSDSWENLVTACQPCNRRKGRRTPQEANMPLARRPKAPRWSLAIQLLAGVSTAYKEWAPFLKAG